MLIKFLSLYHRKTAGGIMSDVHDSKTFQEIFLRCTHINFHTIACLRAKQVLDVFQVSQISGEDSLIKRSQMVLQWMEGNQSFYDSFLWVMEKTEQEHVSNLLKGKRDGKTVNLCTSILK